MAYKNLILDMSKANKRSWLKTCNEFNNVTSYGKVIFVQR